MYEFVQKQKRVAQIVLALLILPFAFFGMESYFSNGTREPHVAEVGGVKVLQREFDQRLREQQDRMRQSLGEQARPEMFETAEFRTAVLEGLIQERLLQHAADSSGLRVTDAQLQQVIAGQPQFQENNAFSIARYKALLRSAGMTEAMYQERLRTELALSQVQTAFSAGTIVSSSVVDRVLKVVGQQRETSQLAIAPEAYLKQVTLEPDAVQKFYEANRKEFEIPEQVRVEYLSLSQAQLAAQTTITPQEVKEYYDQNSTQFRASEERQASHILITVAPGADEKVRAQALERATRIAEEVRKAPQTFADVARKSSQDTGSAAGGGDLGFFAKGAMIKGFDEAVFSMKPGEIVGPVQTEAGYHVIRLTAVRGGSGAGFEQLRAKVEDELRKSRATRRFAELADGFTNIVFEQSDSLKAASDLLKQPVQTSGWFGRQGGDAPKGANERLLAAVFADDVLREKRNTAAIDVGQGVLMAARVIESKPASVRPLEEVSNAIDKRLRLQRASELAIEAGRARLADLRAGKDSGGGWSTPSLVGRQQQSALPEAAMRQVFRVDAAKLPAYAGVEQPGGGYLLLKVTKVVDSKGIDPGARIGFARQASQLTAQEQIAAYIGALRTEAKVSINNDALQRR